MPGTKPGEHKIELVVVFLKRIPKLVRDRFKAACMLNGESMNKAIIRLMKKYSKSTFEIDIDNSRGSKVASHKLKPKVRRRS
jgi:hypothetical protein